VALWALGLVRVSVRARTGGCGSGSSLTDYSGDVATFTADITTFKILINSTLSTEDAAMMMMDIKNYYMGTPLPQFEYMKMLLSRFPEKIVQKYNLNA
jgi:hypothetical protein